MKTRKNTSHRSNYNRRIDSYCSTEQPIYALFEDLFICSGHIRVNPQACIPWTCTRPIVKSGVHRLAASFDRSNHEKDSNLAGLSVGSDSAIVIELEEIQLHYVRSYLKLNGVDETELDQRLNEHTIWYGIIDGAHSHEAINLLQAQRLSWASFQWTVLRIKNGQPMERYKQLARSCNSRQDKRFFIELTFFDELCNLRSAFEDLNLNQCSPTHVQVAKSYFGEEEVTRTMTPKASTAVRLSRDAIDCIGEIMNSDEPGICIENKLIDSGSAKTHTDVMERLDCRVFRNFVNLTSIRQSTPFMNAKSKEEVRAQVNTLYRAKEECFLNSFKAVQHTSISRHYKMALLAIKEEKKFLGLCSSLWPAEMSVLRHNLLRSSLLDSELSTNSGNTFNLLPSLISALQRCNTKLYLEVEEKMKLNIDKSIDREGKSAPSTETSGIPQNQSPPSTTQTP